VLSIVSRWGSLEFLMCFFLNPFATVRAVSAHLYDLSFIIIFLPCAAVIKSLIQLLLTLDGRSRGDHFGVARHRIGFKAAHRRFHHRHLGFHHLHVGER